MEASYQFQCTRLPSMVASHLIAGSSRRCQTLLLDGLHDSASAVPNQVRGGSSNSTASLSTRPMRNKHKARPLRRDDENIL